jgi:hypothetical protein
MRPIIGFSGPAGSGKSTAAKVLTDMGWQRVRFAGPLKAMMKALGCSDEEIDGHLKMAPSLLLGGKTPRFAMQTLGTEWGRNLISPTLWTDAWKHQVDSLPSDIPVVVDDVRFPNEAALIRERGGLLIGLRREGYEPSSEHASEAFAFAPDQWLDNVGEIDTLRYSVSKIAAVWKGVSENDAS